MDVVVWDSEALTPKLDEIGWEEYKETAGISVACLIEVSTGLPTFYHHRDMDGFGLEALADRLESADQVVSFNGIEYDTRVLGATLDRGITIREVDLLKCIWQALGGEKWPKGSWKLDRIAFDLLGIGKSANGSSAPHLYATGRFGQLFSYVYRDVWLTWRIWDHIRAEGWIPDPSGNRLEVDLFES